MDVEVMAHRIVDIPGIVGVALGGSRARGEHSPDSDTDLGLYYRGPLDTVALQVLADELSDTPAAVTEPGGWGPWVDGGGWLRVDGMAVDWIYRDVDRVRRSGEDATAGTWDWHFQVGHPLGFPGTTYAGELFHGRILADPSGDLSQIRLAEFPEALQRSIFGRLGEAEFLLRGSAKALPRRDAAYVCACLFRVLQLCAHALAAQRGRFVLNEKSALLPRFLGEFGERAQSVFDGDLVRRWETARDLLAETRRRTSDDGAQRQG